MSKIKQQSTIKDMILATIEGHIDAQNEKGMKKYGETIDDCSVDAYDWLKMALEEAIDLMQYQQKEIGRLNELLKEKDDAIARLQHFLSQYQLKVAGLTDSKPEPERSPKEALESAVGEYKAVSERDEIIEDLEDEVKGLRDEIENLQGTMQLSGDMSYRTRQENAKLKELLAHYIGDV